MSNAVEFISAYNTVDAKLRAMYRGKGNLQFTDLVRRCAEFNPTVKKYEEELLSFAKLRNAIVHESTRERVIAEPCNDVTRLFTHIAELLSSPPKLSVLKEKPVTGIEGKATLAEAVMLMSEKHYSNLPVYHGRRLLGVLNNRRVVRVIGLALTRGEDLPEALKATCADVLVESDMLNYYKLLSRDDTVQAAIDAFTENRRLLAVLVTERGNAGGSMVNIITASDLPRLLELLED